MGANVLKADNLVEKFSDGEILEVEDGHLLVRKETGVRFTKTVAVFAPKTWIKADLDAE